MTWQDKAIALFGELHWKATLANMVGVNKTTIRRWANGTFLINPAIVKQIEETYEIWFNNKRG